VSGYLLDTSVVIWIVSAADRIPPRLRKALSAPDALAALPPIHRDPFDRLLISQAQCEALTLVTPDKQIREYKLPSLW
jgi:PIN domain nuclease of toxin-antitoxin system